MTTTKGFALAIDDNRREVFALTPKTTERVSGESGTSAVLDTGLVRVVGTNAINFRITTSTTDAVTTSDAYLPASVAEHFKVKKGTDRFAFLASTTTIVYVTTMQ